MVVKHNLLEQALWETLHRLAASYSLQKNLTNSQKKAYQRQFTEFFDTIPYILPDTSLREAFFVAAKTHPINMQDIDSSSSPSKALSEKLFQWHDVVDQYLKRAITRPSYRKLYQMYHQTKHDSAVADTVGVNAILAKLKKNPKAVEAFLRQRFDDYETFTSLQRRKLRDMYMKEAAVFWWYELSSLYSNEPLQRQRTLVLEEFNKNFKRFRDMLWNIPAETWSSFKNRLSSL